MKKNLSPIKSKRKVKDCTVPNKGRELTRKSRRTFFGESLEAVIGITEER